MICIWLLPEVEVSAYLQQQIDDLARTYQAPHFIPHMTVFCGETSDLDAVKAIVKQVSTTQAPLEMRYRDIGATALFYKTTFLQFEPNQALTELNQELHSKLDPNSDYKLYPHLSLLYQQLPIQQKQQIAKTVQGSLDLNQLNQGRIPFDRLAIMSDSVAENAAAVNSWQLHAEYPLGSP